jgi:hypothetical protein
MRRAESPVAVAQRHVAQAERRVARQKALIEELERDRHFAMVENARKILEVLEESLRLARVHLELEQAHYGTKA